MQVQLVAKTGDYIPNDVQQMSRKSDDIQSCVQLHYSMEHDQFNGIVRKLTQECGGNVHDKGVIAVTASSEYGNSSSRMSKNIVDLINFDTKFLLEYQLNPWLCNDFKGRKVRRTHYSIRSTPFDPKDYHPRYWVIEGSRTGNEWKILDKKDNLDVLCNNSVLHTFAIQQKHEQNEYYRYHSIW